MTQVLPFPLAHRQAFVRRQAERFVELGARAAEANLHRTLQLQRDVLLKKGVDPQLVDRETQSLEGVIRAAVWRLVMCGEGSA